MGDRCGQSGSELGWQPPAHWSVPREWVGERAIVLCTGESLTGQLSVLPRVLGRRIAVKDAVQVCRTADVLFLAGTLPRASVQHVPIFLGRYAVVRGKSHPCLPPSVKLIGRLLEHERWSTDPTRVAGFDAGTSAINLAMLFGASEILVCGWDMQGGHFCRHPLPRPPLEHFDRHRSVLPALAEDARRLGVRIVNCSPQSAVEGFERCPLESFL